MYIISALIFLMSALGIHAIFNEPMYEMYFPTVDPDLFWIGLIISILFGVLGRILSQLNAIERRMDQANVTQIKAKKDLGNWPPSV